MLRYTDDSPAYQVTHLRRSPEGENNYRGQLSRQVPSENFGCSEKYDKEQDHLRHDPHDFKITSGDCPADRIFPRHQHAYHYAGKDTYDN